MEEQRRWEVAWDGSWEVEVESDVAEHELKSCSRARKPPANPKPYNARSNR
jgi:hypothetical protein